MTDPHPGKPAHTARLAMTDSTDDPLWTPLWVPMRAIISAALGLVGGGGEQWRHAQHTHIVDSIMIALHAGLTFRVQQLVDNACRTALITELSRLADDDADQLALRDRVRQLHNGL